jgi:phosphatidate phosphatase PAH1
MLEWEHSESSLVKASGAPTHRGRDMFFRADEPQWVLGKFAYGPSDYDLEDEQIDLYLLRGCTGEWESLGSVHTTNEGSHEDVEGVVDTGGRVYFEIPADRRLEPGRHRIHMIVRGDLSSADQYIEVVPEGTPVVLTDVDGTLTTSETEEFFDLLSGTLPEVRPGAPEALQALAAKGYHPIYLTARPEFLGTRTHEFVRERGLPPGIVHTSLFFDGALGSEAVTFKTGELAAFAARGLVPTFAFGNTESDGEAYENAGIQPLDHRVFIEFDDAHGGRRIDTWEAIVAELEALNELCE